jgi:hypothetical protein
MEMADFQWWRCLDGYRISSKGKGVESASDRFERTRPLKIPGLYAKFAKDTPASPNGMLDFCNRFGLLGGGRFDCAPPTDSPPTYVAEAVDLLLQHHWRMRRAINIFEKGDPSELIKYWNSAQEAAWLRVELRREPDGRIGMVFVPPDLIRAMWLQFAQTACSGARLFRCQYCHEPFPIGTGTGRRNTAKYCSNACKVAAFKVRTEGRLKQ